MDTELYSMGEILVDLIPLSSGAPSEGSAYEAHFGGAPANTALAASRLGHRAGFVGAVGMDPLGLLLRGVLEDEGVDTSMLVTKRARTTLALVTARGDGEREYFFYREPWARTADTLLEPSDVDTGRIAEAAVLHFSGFSLSQPSLSEAVEEAVESLVGGDTVISYDPTYRSDVWGSFDAALEAHAWSLAHATLATLNLEEAKIFHGAERPAELASTLLDRHPQLIAVAVRMGPRGAYVKERGGGSFYSPAPSVEVVDTTGAGDVWNAAFLSLYVLEGTGLEEAVRFATAAAALKCSRRGAASAPRRREVEEFMDTLPELS